ncbi:hypothetical protein HMPREF0281_00176 [Corynebacterium ammoniagenes DSM 20306]|uniref:Uncharacterized protein n=1 Tax=Corynebacterium ammoniagenes DSM 20306 TaxID=649754 RepID=A0ABN0AIF7_CORAM|nr:hypothetical protein HMPREF0281_00176 [Corynebacterium ammoniagenes DSM 20306]
MKSRASVATTPRPQLRLRQQRLSQRRLQQNQVHQSLELPSQAHRNQVLRSQALQNQVHQNLELRSQARRNQPRSQQRHSPRQLRQRMPRSLRLQQLQSLVPQSQAVQNLVRPSREHQSLALRSQVQKAATSQPHVPCLNQAALVAWLITHFLPVVAQAIVLHHAQVEERDHARSHKVESVTAVVQTTARISHSLVVRAADVVHRQQ